MRLRFLGTGTSVGVPQIGCACKTCTSSDSRDRRRRCGAYITCGDVAFLIDTPPEMREAVIEYGISKVDAVLLTHSHMDHVAGFDDIRRFNTLNGEKQECDPSSPDANGRTWRIIGRPLVCYAMEETVRQMHNIFPYISEKGGEHGLFRPQVVFNTSDVFTIGGENGALVERIKVEHGFDFPCCGYIVSPSKGEKRLAYISDCHSIGDQALERLKGVDVLILDCLREREHPTHLSLSRALDYVEKVNPKKAYFIHMCHDLTHVEWEERLAHTCASPAWDGLEINLENEKETAS